MLRFRVISKFFENRSFLKSERMKHLWTVDKVVKSPFPDVVIPEMPISEYMWRNLEQWSNKTAVVCAVTDRQYTYEQVYKQSRVFGANLRKKFKIKYDDTIAVMLPNIPEFPIVVLGVLTAGGLVTTLNPIYTAYEVQRQMEMSQPKIAIAVPETVPLIKQALKNAKLKIPVIIIDVNESRPENTVSFKELVDDNYTDLDILKEVKRNVNDVALLLYSSGTTGLPKGVELTHRNIIANSEQQNPSECRLYDETTDSNQDTVLAYLPMFHSYGLTTVTLHKLSIGIKLVSLPRFQPDTFVKALEKHDISIMYMAPPTVSFLAANPDVSFKHFRKLKHIIVGAAPLPHADIKQFLNKIDHEIHFCQAYGLTETSPMATSSPVGFKDFTSVGFAVASTELRVVDKHMNNLGPNEVGELLVKGPNVMKGYKNNPDANAQVFVDKDWLRTGDLVRINENGSVYIADRLKELIKVNAYQVPPAELENIIKDHPAVLDVGVVGIPDEKTGERPKAFIVVNKGFTVSEKEIMEYVNEKVSPYKRIKEVKFIKDIPKNQTGKILRRLLFEQYVKN